MKKSIIFLTILSLLISMFSTISFATEYAPVKPNANLILGTSFDQSFPESGEADYTNLKKLYVNTKGNTSSNRSISYYKTELPEIPEGEVVTSATLKFSYISTMNTNTNTPQIRVYSADGAWNSNTTWETQPIAMAKASDTNETAVPYLETEFPVAEPDATVSILNKNKKVDATVDITAMVKNYINSNTTEDFSFALMPYRIGSGNFFIYLWNDSSQEGYPTITITTEKISPLSLESVTPASGSVISTGDTVSFNFNNAIDASTVSASDFSVMDIGGETVTVTDGDITVSGSTVTLDREWDVYGYYKVRLSGISDIYGDELDGIVNTAFEVGSESLQTTETIDSKTLMKVCKATQSVCATNDHTPGDYSIDTGSDNGTRVQTQGHYILFQFVLPNNVADKQPVSANFSFKTNSSNLFNNTVSAYHVPDYEWTSDAGNDIDYLEKLNEIFAADDNKLDTVYTGPVSNIYTATTDVTQSVADAISSNDTNKKVTFAIYYNATGGVYVASHNYKPQLTINYVGKSFDVVAANPAKGVATSGISDEIKLTLATKIDEAYVNNDYIKLVKISDDTEVEIDITSDGGSTYTITPKDDLAESSEYKVVLKEGITDDVENVLDTDKAVYCFTSGTALVVNKVKFTYEKTPIYDEVQEIENYAAGDEVTAVVTVDNRSINDYDAIMIIAIYGSDGSLEAVDATGGADCAPGQQVTQYSKTIKVPESVIDTTMKAFVWKNLDNIMPVSVHNLINQSN